jgi:hypothetical protein
MSTNALLPLFKSQLDAECHKIATASGLADRGHWLIYWYFTRLYDFTEADVAEVMCDGGGDLGIDAIWIDDEDFVHFYQFKNPESQTKEVSAGEIDKMISGLELILRKKHKKIANPSLRARVEDIYQQVRNGYRIHVVSSGGGIPHESEIKLNALVDELRGPSSSLISWRSEPLPYLQETFYQQRLPAIEDPITFDLQRQPYMLRSGIADSYSFHATGEHLASLYERFGEALLQRNIRIDQGNTAANRSIEATCSGSDSENFLHFNNGVTFLCDSAVFDPIQSKLTLHKAQVVNGGQTVRILHRTSRKGSIKTGVLVPLRAITNSRDKDFALNVAVNQNNQNQMGTGFLRSNDAIVVQLDHALASHGWYLERRARELATSTEDERAAIERRIGGPLDGHTIKLKEGAQAYVATFFSQPELAKKNVKKIFTSIDNGGFYERVFSAEMTAEKLIIAHQLKAHVDSFVKRFSACKRKRDKAPDWESHYESLLGNDIVRNFAEEIDQVMPQCAIFVCGTVFRDFCDFQRRDPSELPHFLGGEGDSIIREHLCHILICAKRNKSRANKSWPALLKSNSFFERVCAYIEGIRAAPSTHN